MILILRGLDGVAYLGVSENSMLLIIAEILLAYGRANVLFGSQGFAGINKGRLALTGC